MTEQVEVMALLDLLVRKVYLAMMVLMEQTVRMERLAQQARKVQQERMETMVPQDPLVHKAYLAMMAQTVQTVRMEQLAL